MLQKQLRGFLGGRSVSTRNQSDGFGVGIRDCQEGVVAMRFGKTGDEIHAETVMRALRWDGV